MKTIRLAASLTPSYPLKKIAPPEKILFLDIETTGFSANSSIIYLIGCLRFEADSSSWQLLQWFAETPEEEPVILQALFTLLHGYSTLIHYNGTSFDLPFIRKRSEVHGLNCPLSQITSIDLYQKIRPWKAALSLTSLKQKAVELSLGIRRTESYTGRQFIAAYQDYVSTRKNALFSLLLTHNEEDLKGLFNLLPLLTYTDLPEMDFSLIRQTITQDHASTNLELFFQAPCTFLLPFHLEHPFFLQGGHNQLYCRLPMYRGELKYFYPNYKDYYYLPCEDMAVHKSVGSYVAREARKKATPQTCYTKKNSLFFPQPTLLWQPAFLFSYQSRPYYAEYREEIFSNPAAISLFLRPFFPLS